MAKKAAAKKKAPPRIVLNEKTMEAWHRRIAKAGGVLALTLARRKRSPAMIDELLLMLEPVVSEMQEVRDA